MPVLGELELAWRLLGNRFVAVTGTNGKTTTVELLGAIWREAGLPVAVAGQRRHAGRVSGRRSSTLPRRWSASARASSSRTRAAFAPECAVLLNVEPDHLDRHGTLDAYRAAKLRIFAEPGARRHGDPPLVARARARRGRDAGLPRPRA